MKTKAIISKLILMTSLFFACPASGEEMPAAIGKIISVENQVTIIRDQGKEFKAEVKLPVFAGDRIVTGEDGVVRFSIKKSFFKLGSDSEMAIDEFSEIEDEKDQPVLQLIIGLLESVIKSRNGKPDLQEIHTPTAIAGVRGTEFDTVVSLDGTTLVAVDEGRVELDWEKSKAVVENGTMGELKEDADDINHSDALPKHKRDWKQWRNEKEKNLAEILPQMLIRHRKRFEKWSDQHTESLDRLKTAQKKVAGTMADLKTAKNSGDKKAVEHYAIQLKEQFKVLRDSIKQSRRHLNRSKTMTNHMENIRKFIEKNKVQFNETDQAAIYSHMDFIRQKGKQLKTDFRNLAKDLIKTFKQGRKLRSNKIEHKKKKWRQRDKKAKKNKDENSV